MEVSQVTILQWSIHAVTIKIVAVILSTAVQIASVSAERSSKDPRNKLVMASPAPSSRLAVILYVMGPNALASAVLHAACGMGKAARPTRKDCTAMVASRCSLLRYGMCAGLCSKY